MSVIVKGMQMPKNCIECSVRGYDANAGEEYCPFSNIECLSVGRQNDCPLVELPEKHGRLIDRDELIEILTTAIRNMKGMASFIGAEDDPEIKMEIKAYTDVYNGVRELPTVVEAEYE